jgi:SpoVK/Ycf46/Vps4 family AAA+-type ATPase
MSKYGNPGELSFLTAFMKAEEASKDPDIQRHGVQINAESHHDAALLAGAAKHCGLRVTGIKVNGEAIEEQDLKTSIAMPNPTRPPPASLFRKKRAKGARAELDQLIGLGGVKQQVSDVIDLARVQALRAKKGFPILEMSQHLVFTGNPGTGKTTVARIIGDIYQELGLLSKGHFTEVDGRGLIAEYIGQTAAKTEKVIAQALDGVLFIDEAYALTPEGTPNDYGQEAIATLIKMMEDHRDRLIVILAGYENEMERMLSSNPGLKSRFKTKIDFPDYEPAELLAIFEHLATEKAYVLSPEASKKTQALFSQMHADRGKEFGNGRSVRNAFERAVMNQARRLASGKRPNRKQLQLITAEDIPALTELSW